MLEQVEKSNEVLTGSDEFLEDLKNLKIEIDKLATQDRLLIGHITNLSNKIFRCLNSLKDIQVWATTTKIEEGFRNGESSTLSPALTKQYDELRLNLINILNPLIQHLHTILDTNDLRVVLEETLDLAKKPFFPYVDPSSGMTRIFLDSLERAPREIGKLIQFLKVQNTFYDKREHNPRDMQSAWVTILLACKDLHTKYSECCKKGWIAADRTESLQTEIIQLFEDTLSILPSDVPLATVAISEYIHHLNTTYESKPWTWSVSEPPALPLTQ